MNRGVHWSKLGWRSRLLLGGLGLGSTVLVATLWTASASNQTPAHAQPPLPVQIAHVRSELTPMAGSASYPAILHYDREARLGFRLAGRLADVPARIGQEWPAGSVVARLEPDLYAAAAERSAADYARAARAADRLQGLAQEGATGAAQAKDAQDQSRAAQAGFAAARSDLRATRLTMPFAGMVVERLAERGEVVGAGQAVITIADTASPLLARAQLPASVASGLPHGQAATIMLSDGQALPARLLRKAAAADTRTGMVTIELALDHAPKAIAGSPASLRLDHALAPVTGAAQLIPAEALLEARGGEAWVYVIDPSSRARKRKLTLLGLSDRDIRVAGLPADARVITLGAGFVGEGQRVEVTP